VAAAVTAPAVGTLLIFSLIVGPASAACAIISRPGRAALLSVGFALLAAWLGIVLAYDSGWPVGFFIALLVSAQYLGARLWAGMRGR
jgi:zinc/manganese transport system permease protein